MVQMKKLLQNKKEETTMQLQGFLWKATRWLVGLVIAMSLLGCEIKPPSPPIVWIVGLDITTSISKESFMTMRDQMIPKIARSKAPSSGEPGAAKRQSSLASPGSTGGRFRSSNHGALA